MWRRWLEIWHLFRLFGVLRESEEYRAAQYAVEKVCLDKSFHPTKDHFLKRREAEEWAGHWLRERGVRGSAWKLNLLIEYEVGRWKGKL